jgi:hypothetical protein
MRIVVFIKPGTGDTSLRIDASNLDTLASPPLLSAVTPLEVLFGLISDQEK